MFLALFLSFSLLPFGFRLPVLMISWGLFLLAVAFVYYNFKNFFELSISSKGNKMVVLSSGMMDKRHIDELFKKINVAILDEKKYQELKGKGELESFLLSNPSETMKLKNYLENFTIFKRSDGKLCFLKFADSA